MLYIWLIAACVLFVLELYTAGTLAIWFAISALIAAGISLFGEDTLALQIGVFTISSAILTFFGINVLKKSPTKSSQPSPQRVYSILNKEAIVTKEIDTLKGVGQISINGDFWSAKSKNQDVIIPENSKVRVLEIDGVRAIVEVIEE